MATASSGKDMQSQLETILADSTRATAARLAALFKVQLDAARDEGRQSCLTGQPTSSSRQPHFNGANDGNATAQKAWVRGFFDSKLDGGCPACSQRRPSLAERRVSLQNHLSGNSDMRPAVPLALAKENSGGFGLDPEDILTRAFGIKDAIHEALLLDRLNTNNSNRCRKPKTCSINTIVHLTRKLWEEKLLDEETGTNQPDAESILERSKYVRKTQSLSTPQQGRSRTGSRFSTGSIRSKPTFETKVSALATAAETNAGTENPVGIHSCSSTKAGNVLPISGFEERLSKVATPEAASIAVAEGAENKDAARSIVPVLSIGKAVDLRREELNADVPARTSPLAAGLDRVLASPTDRIEAAKRKAQSNAEVGRLLDEITADLQKHASINVAHANDDDAAAP